MCKGGARKDESVRETKGGKSDYPLENPEQEENSGQGVSGENFNESFKSSYRGRGPR